jgi:hypothetical protein
MHVSQRLQAAAACLALGVLAQLGLSWHLRGSEVSSYPELTAPLRDFPAAVNSSAMLVGSDGAPSQMLWFGRDADGLEEFRGKLPYRADDLLYRGYIPAQGGRPVFIYMIYSRHGEDRKHHPEVCVRDASGATEDVAARRQIALDGNGERSVMRFRFRTGAARFTTVYYWHYTLEAMPRKGQSFLQALHQRLSLAAPSMTVQVWLDAMPDELNVVEQGFLVAVDTALRQNHLPATARIGCNRLPIALTRD